MLDVKDRLVLKQSKGETNPQNTIFNQKKWCFFAVNTNREYDLVFGESGLRGQHDVGHRSDATGRGVFAPHTSRKATLERVFPTRLWGQHDVGHGGKTCGRGVFAPGFV